MRGEGRDLMKMRNVSPKQESKLPSSKKESSRIRESDEAHMSQGSNLDFVSVVMSAWGLPILYTMAEITHQRHPKG